MSTTIGSPSATVASGGFSPLIAAGTNVSGTGITPGTTVSSVAGNTLTLSANATATATGTATLTFSAPFASTVNPAPVLPISVQSSTLLCSSIAPETCVLGNLSGTGTASFSSTTAQTALLYPGPLVTDPQVAGVTTTSGNASVTVASGGFPAVAVGMGVTGTGVPSNATVLAISGNTVTLSANATVSSTTTLTFLPPNYSAWAGDQADSAPSYNSDYGADVATSFQDVGPSSNGTLTLPVYPLTLNVTSATRRGTVSGLTAADAGGGDTLALNLTAPAPTGRHWFNIEDWPPARSVRDPGDRDRW